jgi:Na+-transporting NADH:ubiquinone oxidoreductase subunit NqrE
MLAMMVIPAAIALHSVRTPATLQVQPDASPHGYTWSLLLFVIPIVVIAVWFLFTEDLEIPQRAFWRTIGILVPIGCLLDVIFAQWFFVYPNPRATLGILAPAFGHWVPVEEYVFYLTGFITILLLYVWLSEYWLAAYTVEDYRGEARALPKLLKLHPMSLVVGAVLIVAGVIYKKWFSEVPDGIPGYFIVLVSGGLVSSAGLYPVTRRFINWRAFSLTMFFILLVSMLWEATLALPYGWWDYQHRAMLGVFIGAWSNLPIEAVLVWLAVTYGTVILFESVKIWQASGRRARQIFLGDLGSAGKP